MGARTGKCQILAVRIGGNEQIQGKIHAVRQPATPLGSYLADQIIHLTVKRRICSAEDQLGTISEIVLEAPNRELNGSRIRLPPPVV